jgi:mannose-6-phosphate isomerase-like protein (cupin superfamily)
VLECRKAHPNSVYKNYKENGVMTFHKNIFELAQQNTFFRKELVTGKYSQVVLMSIPVGGEIGMEKHEVDQTLVFVSGQGQAIVNGETSDIYAGYLVFVPAGAQHNFKNIGSDELKLFTLYAPSAHEAGALEKTKSE